MTGKNAVPNRSGYEIAGSVSVNSVARKRFVVFFAFDCESLARRDNTVGFALFRRRGISVINHRLHLNRVSVIISEFPALIESVVRPCLVQKNLCSGAFSPDMSTKLVYIRRIAVGSARERRRLLERNNVPVLPFESAVKRKALNFVQLYVTLVVILKDI